MTTKRKRTKEEDQSKVDKNNNKQTVKTSNKPKTKSSKINNELSKPDNQSSQSTTNSSSSTTPNPSAIISSPIRRSVRSRRPTSFDLPSHSSTTEQDIELESKLSQLTADKSCE